MIKYSIKFDLQKVKSENKPVRVRICYLGNRVDIPLGFTWIESLWDKTKQRPCKNTQNNHYISANEASKIISEYETYLHAIFADFAIKNKVPAPEEIKTCFYEKTGKTSPKRDKTFAEIIDEFIESEATRNGWAKNSFKKYQTLKNRLTDFDEKLLPNTVTEKKLYAFIDFLFKKNYRNATVFKSISSLKHILRWCATKGYYTGNIYDTFNQKFKGTDGNLQTIIFLEWDELMSLYNCKLVLPHLEYTRDVYCFCCFTGLRYSDVAKLTRFDVKKDFIEIVTQKTADNIIIPLNKYSRAILDKYKNYTFEKNLALPVYVNQQMNKNIKSIAYLAGIKTPKRKVYFRNNERIEEVYEKWQLITTHTARKTFVCQAINLGIHPKVIMSITGHKKYEALKPYEKVIDLTKKREMAKFDML